MGNIMKYEFKSSYKFNLAIYALMILSTLAVLTRLDKWQNSTIMLVASLICVAGSVLVLATSFNSLNKDLKSSSKYLTYTLPVSTSSIIMSKILIGVIWIHIVSIFIIGILYLVVSLVFKDIALPNLLSLISFRTILVYIYSIINLIGLFGAIYFSVAISQLTPKFDKFLGILAFIGVNTIETLVTLFLVKYVPWVASMKMPNISFGYMDAIDISANYMPFHVPTVVFSVLFTLALVYGSIYLLDKKVDI